MALLDRTVALTRAYAGQHGVTLSVDAVPDVLMVEGDAELLHQALVNLLLNGIHATTPSGSVCALASAAAPEYHCPPMVTLSVSDTGHGIASDDLPHIFDPFFTTRLDGTGLGLSIVQQIIQEHSGMIEVSSEIGKGTTFVIHMPAFAA